MKGSEISLSPQTCPIRYTWSPNSPLANDYPGSVSGLYQLQSKTAASGHACTIKMHADTCTNARTHAHSDRDGWIHSSTVYLHVLDSHPILHFEAQCIT